MVFGRVAKFFMRHLTLGGAIGWEFRTPDVRYRFIGRAQHPVLCPGVIVASKDLYAQDERDRYVLYQKSQVDCSGGEESFFGDPAHNIRCFGLVLRKCPTFAAIWNP